LPKDDDIIVENTNKIFTIKKRVINLQKKTKEEEYEKPKEYNLEIPSSPISSNLNPIKNIRKHILKRYEPEEVYSLPPKEKLLKTKIPDRRIYPKIYDEIQKTKKDLDFHLEFLKQVPHQTFNKLMPEKMLNMMKEMHKNLVLMKIFYIYTHYKNDKFFIKKTYWTRWKKSTTIFNSDNITEIHLTNITGHCFSMEKIIIREVRCGLHHESMRYYDCLCLRTRLCLKRILIRHYFMKYIDKRRYYLYKWYKNIFRKIRIIYL
jgi:hypothetical protein